MRITDSDVNEYELTQKSLDELEASLSTERFATYLAATDGDRERAILLYTWNTAVSAAFYGPLQALEVALRNALNRELVKVYGQVWYDNPDIKLDYGCRERLQRTRQDIRKSKYLDDPPHVVAALSFGFWVSLLGPGGKIDRGRNVKGNYEMTLWRPALHSAFIHASKITRKKVHEPLNHLRFFRNRIAHHEPIFARHLRKDYDSILEITGWISPEKRDWIIAHSRIPEIIEVSRDTRKIQF